MPEIRRLEESIASRIAAGEVVERPASVAKELLENSIDSGAADIRILLEQGGKASFVIEDDGDGIAYDEMPLAIERYATSKIRTLEDLEKVGTLGYRGEALSSIGAVSRLEIRSRTRDDESGGMIVCEGGAIQTHLRMPSQYGTRIQVDDLFYNLPARRKFLKSATAELKRIIQIVKDYALVYPGIRFRLEHEGKQLLDIGGGKTTDEVLESLWGDESRSVFARYKKESVEASVWWNNLPGSRRVGVTVFVNCRRVQDPVTRSALNSTGSSIYGEWVVAITLPPEDVDVNIHPAKAEVRFRKSGPVFEAVRRSAQEALLKTGGLSSALPHDGEQSFQKTLDPWENSVPPAGFFKKPKELFGPPQSQEIDAGMKELTFGEDRSRSARKYLGQAQGGYLVFDDPRGLCLVDAHAAHERIIYEQIEDSFRDKAVDTQRLVFEQELPPGLVASVSLYREALLEMGFAFALPEDDGARANAPALVSVPVLRGLGRLSPLEMLRSAIKGIEEEEDPSKRDREVWWRWARTACRDAVKMGDRVESEEAFDLIERLEKCRSPYSCPHGRPTTIFLAGDKLKSWFER